MAEIKQKLQHQQRLVKTCDNTTYEKTPFLRGLKNKIKKYDERWTNSRRSLTSRGSDLSELFCQLIHYEQMQREIESWMQVKESEFNAIMNSSATDSLETQRRKLEKFTVCNIFQFSDFPDRI